MVPLTSPPVEKLKPIKLQIKSTFHIVEKKPFNKKETICYFRQVKTNQMSKLPSSHIKSSVPIKKPEFSRLEGVGYKRILRRQKLQKYQIEEEEEEFRPNSPQIPFQTMIKTSTNQPKTKLKIPKPKLRIPIDILRISIKQSQTVKNRNRQRRIYPHQICWSSEPMPDSQYPIPNLVQV